MIKAAGVSITHVGVEGPHGAEFLRRQGDEPLPVLQRLVGEGPLQVPALHLQQLPLGEVLGIAPGDLPQLLPQQGILRGESRVCDNLLQLPAVPRDILPHVAGHGRKAGRHEEPAAEEGPAGGHVEVIPYRNGRLPSGGDVGPEGRVVGGLVLAEAGVPVQPGYQVPGVEETQLRLLTGQLSYDILHQRHEAPAGRPVFRPVVVHPVQGVVRLQPAQKGHNLAHTLSSLCVSDHVHLP